ncbi:hypothetical protein G4G27_14775 [Sphingomonas sp. So64.6b]|uniref:hypothetical protein n=1 Tax=Sphingomonas sp. So64.6b TaxID=2997354 RepID=UPI0016008201|nr:hypothetical protein [Sphingomonas sp. So64.6b]QNA85117.1 hypothetical protein G4G27_14775 [Sphingomonas sp. So64.6b]
MFRILMAIPLALMIYGCGFSQKITRISIDDCWGYLKNDSAVEGTAELVYFYKAGTLLLNRKCPKESIGAAVIPNDKFTIIKDFLEEKRSHDQMAVTVSAKVKIKGTIFRNDPNGNPLIKTSEIYIYTDSLK